MENIRSVYIQYLQSPEEADKSKQLMAGKFLFPGFTYEYSIAGKELPNGKFKYITGVNESEFSDEEKKEEIKIIRKELEDFYGEGSLDNKNEEFWKNIKLVLSKKATSLDIKNSPEDKLFYYIIKGGGVPEIAPSYEEAIGSDQPKKWYLIEPGEYADLSAEDDKYSDKAIASLVDLNENKTFDDMMLVHKNLISADRGITRQTPKSMLYKDLSEFIKGKIVKTDKRLTPKQFVETFSLLKKDKKKLYVTAYVNDALYFNFIHINQDNQFINTETKAKYGTNKDAVINKLSLPTHTDELENLKLRVEKKWSD